MSDVKFLYERKGVVLHIVEKGLTNHELRSILVGFWLSLDEDDRIDHIKELQHYTEAGSVPPPVSINIARAVAEARRGS